MTREIFDREAKRHAFQRSRSYKPRAPKERVSWFARKPELIAPPVAPPQPEPQPEPQPVIITTAPPKRRWWKFWS